MTCTVTTAAELYHIFDLLPVRQSVKIAGIHGIGKSEIVREYTVGRNLNFNVIYLGQCELTDIKGLPLLNTKEAITQWLKGVWWPKTNGDKDGGVLLLEEFNRAPHDVQAVALELANEGTLDGEALPENWRVVICVNEFGDYITNTPDPAVTDRFFHIKFQPSVDGWLSHARALEVSPAIINFIAAYPACLDPADKLDPQLKYQSRRSWFRVDAVIKKNDLLHRPITAEARHDLRIAAQGWLGESTATAFSAYIDANMKDYTPKMILYEFPQHKEALSKETALHDHMMWMKNAAEYLHAACSKQTDKLLSDRKYDEIDHSIMDINTWQNIMDYSDLLNSMGMREVASANAQLFLSCFLARAPWDKEIGEASPFFKLCDLEFDPDLGIPPLDFSNPLDRYVDYMPEIVKPEETTSSATP